MEGLLCKTYRPNRYPRTWAAGSGSNGLDLRSSGSNRGHSSEIGRLGGLGARGGGANRRSRAPRRRARRSWPFGRYRGSFGSRFGAKGRARHGWSTGVPREAVRGWKGGRRRCRAARTAHLAGVHCADLGSGLRAKTTSAKERVGCGEAHRGPVVAGAAAQGGRRRGPAAEVGRSSRRG